MYNYKRTDSKKTGKYLQGRSRVGAQHDIQNFQTVSKTLPLRHRGNKYMY